MAEPYKHYETLRVQVAVDENQLVVPEELWIRILEELEAWQGEEEDSIDVPNIVVEQAILMVANWGECHQLRLLDVLDIRKCTVTLLKTLIRSEPFKNK